MSTLLILSVGSLVGSNILDAVAAFRPGLRVLGINSEAEAPNNFRCDRCWLAPPASEAGAYWQRVEQVLADEHPDAVLAGRDDDIPLMAGWREQHPRWAGVLVTGASALADAMTDKLLGHAWAQARDLPFAPTIAADHPDAGTQACEWLDRFGALIAKPRSGNGSRGVRLLLDAAQIEAALGETAVVLQPYLADAGDYRRLREQAARGWPLFWTPVLTQYVAQTVIGPRGDILGRCDMEARMVAGRCEWASLHDDPDFRVMGDRYAEALAGAGWRGPVNVQAVWHPALGYRVIEFCARVAGGMYPRTLLGFDEMALTLSAWTGQAFSRGPLPKPVPVALRVTRDVGLEPEACRELRERGVWSRSPTGAGHST